MTKKIVTLSLILVFAALLTACGAAKTSTVGTSTAAPHQLDPQGDWEFTVTDANGLTLTWSEDLYELTPPAVTSNTGVGSFGQGQSGEFTVGVSGSVSGTATINYTVTATNGLPGQGGIPLGSISLTGTIAESQTSTSGTWTTAGLPDLYSSGFPAGDSGTWTAQLLAPVTGTYSGTLIGSSAQISVTMSLTEDTSQTSGTMGIVTGTVTISGSPCFNSSTPLNLYPATSNFASQHIGEQFGGSTMPDSNGQTIFFSTPPVNGVDPITAALNNMTFNVQSGPCNGQQFVGTLTK